jgi:hypothetical protein
LHSYQRLKLAFQAGYEALDHLDAAVAGDEQSTSYIAELLAKAPTKVKADPPAPILPKRKSKEKKEIDISTAMARSSPAAKPSTTELFSRPHPLSQLSGKRRVPVLFSANSIPILRIKKPQPESLSGFIRHRIEQRQRRHDRKHWLMEQIQFARYEDLWDEIVEREVGVRDDDGRELTWAEEFEVAKNQVDWLIRLEGKKNVAMAAKMQGIVDRETEMFERERAERKEAKRVERVARRSAGDEKAAEESG